MFNNNPALVRPSEASIDECEVLAKTCAHQARLMLRMASEAQSAALKCGAWPKSISARPRN